MTAPKRITISAKCGDRFGYSIEDEDGLILVDVNSCYVPDGFGIGGGDYVKMEIDIESGRIIGWDAEKAKALSLATAPADE